MATKSVKELTKEVESAARLVVKLKLDWSKATKNLSELKKKLSAAKKIEKAKNAIINKAQQKKANKKAAANKAAPAPKES